MQVREWLANHPKVAAAGMAAVLCLCGVWAYTQLRPESVYTKYNAYYSDDDGKTFFAGEAGRAFEMQQQSKPAYPAAVYRSTKTGSTSVGYLTRTDPDAAARLSKAKQAADEAKPRLQAGDPKARDVIEAWIQAQSASQASAQVKKPGGTWLAAGSPEGRQIVESFRSDTSLQYQNP